MKRKRDFFQSYVYTITVNTRIADPDLVCMFLGLLDADLDPVCGSGSSNSRYGSGSGSFYNQAKIV